MGAGNFNQTNVLRCHKYCIHHTYLIDVFTAGLHVSYYEACIHSTNVVQKRTSTRKTLSPKNGLISSQTDISTLTCPLNLWMHLFRAFRIVSTHRIRIVTHLSCAYYSNHTPADTVPIISTPMAKIYHT